MVITLLLLCIFLILLCHYLIHHGRFWKLIDQIPGPPPLLIIGNALFWCTCPVEELLKTLEKYLKIYHPVGKQWIFNHAGVFASHPDDVQTILSNSKEHIGKGFAYTFLNSWLGTGLLTSEETAMGISLKDMGAFQQQYRKTVYEITKLILARLISPWFYFDMIFALSPMGKRQAKNLKILHGFTEKIIAERKQYHKSTNGQYLKQFENNSVNDDEEIIGIRRKRLAMLDLLIAASRNNKMSDLDIREEVDTFVLGGYETTAISISFTILLLAEHKNIQDRVRKEVSAVMLENNGKLTMTAINNMPYLERCLKESLRLYPSLPNIMRVASEDLKIQSYIVPSGTILHIPIKFIHRNSDFWPNPDVFDPDRFLPENIQNRHSFSYLPFSAGARNCIGQRFAMLELKAIIATLVHNFYLEPIDYLKDLQFRLDLVTRVADPIRVKFIPIEQMQPFKAN
ncbi:cytochrome P450 4C1-like isoform X2 [Linepithema humile]|uniref:cytochrome P450 4C1-like isoform X2 n=1 Tax=Linepithema humile TaxID=83485 RepID=UPI00351F569D